MEAVVGAAFDEPPDGHVVRMLRALDSSGATRARIVAVADKGIVGHVQLSRGWLDARRSLVEVLVLSPLSVAPDHQRRGIGAQLVAAAVTAAGRLQAPAVFLEGSPAYYSRCGFEAAVARGFAAPSVRIPEPAFQVTLLPNHQEWMVGQLIYPEAFWATDAVGLRDPLLRDIEGSSGPV